MIPQFIKNLVYYTFPLQLLFASEPHPRRSRSIIRLVLDWDGTLTKRDTLHVIAGIGYDHNRDRDLTPWDDIVQAYISDYADYEAHYTPIAKDRTKVSEESEWLASLKDVEQRSVERAKLAGIFTGVTKQEIVSASKSAIYDQKIELRHSWRELLSLARGTDQQTTPEDPLVSVLSVNWSATFIKACLETSYAEPPTANKSIMDLIPVFANEVPPISNKATPTIYTSSDKLAMFNKLRGTDDRVTVYVGDSITDFDCLVAADVGICVRDDPIGSGQKELKETLERVGFEVLQLTRDAWNKDRNEARGKIDGQVREGKKRIWWVTDLEEVVRFIKNDQ